MTASYTPTSFSKMFSKSLTAKFLKIIFCIQELLRMYVHTYMVYVHMYHNRDRNKIDIKYLLNSE